jgi:hypothetical protein
MVTTKIGKESVLNANGSRSFLRNDHTKKEQGR